MEFEATATRRSNAIASLKHPKNHQHVAMVYLDSLSGDLVQQGTRRVRQLQSKTMPTPAL
jgi:hypothetical protein